MDRQYGRQPVAEVFTDERGFLVFQHIIASRELVEHARQPAAKAGLVRAALAGRDVIDIRNDILAIGVGVLHGDGDADAAGNALQIDRRLVDGRLSVDGIAHEIDQSAFEMVLALFGLAVFLDALVDECERPRRVQIRQFAQAARDLLRVKLRRLEHLGIGMERDLRAALSHGADHFQRPVRLARMAGALFVGVTSKMLAI